MGIGLLLKRDIFSKNGDGFIIKKRHSLWNTGTQIRIEINRLEDGGFTIKLYRFIINHFFNNKIFKPYYLFFVIKYVSFNNLSVLIYFDMVSRLTHIHLAASLMEWYSVIVFFSLFTIKGYPVITSNLYV